MNHTGMSSTRLWLTVAILIVMTMALSAFAATPSAVAEPASPVDSLILKRTAYVGLMLLAMGTAWFLLLIPVSVPVATNLRQLLALSAVGGLMAGALSPQQLNVLAISGFGLLLLATWRRHRPLLLGGALALGASRALIGHPVSRDPSFLLMPLMILHVSCAAYWVGSLWPLHRVLGVETLAGAATVVTRFSRLAVVVVSTLALVGVVTALIHLAWPIALLESWYGQLLIMKTTWFTVLMAIAAYHKLKLAPRLVAGDPRSARHMRWGIRAEALIMLLVILLSGLLASTPPEAAPP